MTISNIFSIAPDALTSSAWCPLLTASLTPTTFTPTIQHPIDILFILSLPLHPNDTTPSTIIYNTIIDNRNSQVPANLGPPFATRYRVSAMPALSPAFLYIASRGSIMSNAQLTPALSNRQLSKDPGSSMIAMCG